MSDSGNMQNARVLIVDDDALVGRSLGEFLEAQGYRTATASGASEAMRLLDDGARRAGGQEPFGIVLVDMNMAGGGVALIRDMRRAHPSLVPVAIDEFARIESAVEAMREGAADYLTKPVVDEELSLAVSRAQKQHVLVAENQTLRSQLSERFGLTNLVGADHRMQKVYELAEAVAPTRTTVLVTGPSGTGKTMLARAIHQLSERGSEGEQAGPFVTFSCGSIPETLLESELFGHAKGAFTGADYEKQGKCLAADGGTLFIDEINSATPALQLKLLRVLQERTFEPVGSTRSIEVDVRFVLASSEDLAELVQQGRFREDLYYRINVVNIQMPPLRQRIGDVPLLAEHFLEKYCRQTNRQRRFSDAAMAALRAYHWPGNVRELENAVERCVVLSRSVQIELDDLPEPIAAMVEPARKPHAVNGHALHDAEQSVQIPALSNGWTPMPLSSALQEPERQIIHAALQANDWNRQETARQLGINRTTLYKKIRHHRLDEPG